MPALVCDIMQRSQNKIVKPFAVRDTIQSQAIPHMMRPLSSCVTNLSINHIVVRINRKNALHDLQFLLTSSMTSIQ